MTAIKRYDAETAKANLKKLKSQKSVDPNRFTPGKATATQSHTYFFYILAPLESGEPCSDGKTPGAMTAQYGMDGQFAVKGGNHWASQKPYACPRIQGDEKCDLCDTGFELLKDIPKTEENKKQRSAVAKTYLGQEYFMANIYFHPKFAKQNPPHLNGKVMYTDLPRAILDRCESVLESDPNMQGKAAGVFYDPMNSFPLEMTVTLVNGYNNYGQSAFLSIASPIAATEEEIEQILASRHYLFDKREKVDQAQIRRIHDALVNATHDEEAPQDDTPTTVTEEAAPAPVAQTTKPTGVPAANKTAPAATTKPATAPAAKTAAQAAKTSVTPTGKTPTAAPAKATPPAAKVATKPVAPPVEEPPAEDEADMAALVSALQDEENS